MLLLLLLGQSEVTGSEERCESLVRNGAMGDLGTNGKKTKRWHRLVYDSPRTRP